MIRVGFVLTLTNNGWLGGINYFRNLIRAIYANPGRKIEPVIFVGYDSDDKLLENFPAATIVKDHIFDSRSFQARIRRVLRRTLHRDIVLERFLTKMEISVLSHSGSIGRGSLVLTIGWIPDFQHKYLPSFFSKKELSDRDKYFQEICAECTRVIFSSNVAKCDAEKFYPAYSEKFRLLHFVPDIEDISDLPDIITLKEKYQIKGPYFIVPNQFWIHKNHSVIIDALSILKKQGIPVTVVATGNTTDYRQPDYYRSLQKKIQDMDLAENFLTVGIVPYRELLSLMIHAIAIINPSLFEGWSTSVEEAKVLNLNVILSDIPVHREQNPSNGVFFPPNDSRRLSEIMFDAIHGGSEKTVVFTRDLVKISEKLSESQMKFAQEYEKIVLDISIKSEKVRMR